jgi:hypothetical protein
MSDNASELTASRKRALQPQFVQIFSLVGSASLRDRLPLRLCVPEGTPPSPKRRYRSDYRYLGYDDLTQPGELGNLTLFEVALRLFDFASLRDYLAQSCYVLSTKGQVPFDPVSLFLCVCLRRELVCGWGKLARLLAGEHGRGWRRRFGFQAGVTPSASGLRFFFDAVKPERFEEINCLLIDSLHQAGLLPERSTFPGDLSDRGMTISHDLMLHEACSNMRCAYVTESCYQPGPRPCRAQEAGKEGCDCREKACAQACQRATPRDREARYIHYEGCNKTADLPPSLHSGQGGASGAPRGRDVYGYASAPDRLLDDRFACAWTLQTGGLYPANSDERKLFPASFARLQARYPWLKIGEVLADAALGFQDCLDPIWKAGALRMVDIRADKTDADPQLRLRRGYNENGHPLCFHGYTMQSNGHDYRRRRTKWCCDKTCRQDAERPLPDCPYLAALHKHGQVINVGRTLPDGCVRLAREVPYGSDIWKRRYGRRNLSESRNGLLQGMGLKRLPSFGLRRAHREVALGDLLENLHTLSRLVMEATTLALKDKPG